MPSRRWVVLWPGTRIACRCGGREVSVIYMEIRIKGGRQARIKSFVGGRGVRTK